MFSRPTSKAFLQISSGNSPDLVELRRHRLDFLVCELSRELLQRPLLVTQLEVNHVCKANKARLIRVTMSRQAVNSIIERAVADETFFRTAAQQSGRGYRGLRSGR